MTPPEKSALVARVSHAMGAGLSLRMACQQVGVSAASYLRWKAALDAAEGDAWAALTAKKPTGRPPSITFSDEELAIARWHRMTKASLEIALFFFMKDPDVSPETVAALRQIEERGLETGKAAAWPLSVQRAFHVTDDQRARFRGQKAAMETEMVTRRGHLWIDEEGTVHDLLAGELWELDDYSCNQAFTYRDPQSGELRVGRQTLAAIDYASARLLGFDLIGRERDAYRGEDVVRYIGRLFRAHGVPRFLRLERGTWESSYVHGIECAGLTGLWGGLDALCNIQHVFKSKGKGLMEGSFNHLQNWLAHAGRDLGRYAGEFQASAKAHRQVKSAKSLTDPRLAGFWSQEDAAAAHVEAAKIINSRPKNRKALGERVSPNDLVARQGWNTLPLPESEAWRLLPYKKRTIIRDGHATVNPGGGWPELSFVVNGHDGLYLENGHAILVAYDPLDPASGAYVANADQTPKNRAGWGVGQCLVAAAPYAAAAPQVNLSGRRHESIDLRRRASAAGATDFRAVVAGAPGAREAAAFDGTGRAAAGGSLAPISRPAPAKPATARPEGRAGLAPAPRVSGGDEAALFGVDRAEQLRRLEEEAAKHF